MQLIRMYCFIYYTKPCIAKRGMYFVTRARLCDNTCIHDFLSLQEHVT